jgi:hypothetical protein
LLVGIRSRSEFCRVHLIGIDIIIDLCFWEAAANRIQVAHITTSITVMQMTPKVSVTGSPTNTTFDVIAVGTVYKVVFPTSVTEGLNLKFASASSNNTRTRLKGDSGRNALKPAGIH